MKINKTLAVLALSMIAGSTLSLRADDHGNYGAHGGFGPDYGYRKSHTPDHRAQVMTRAELARQIERQGYADVRSLRPNAYGGDWQATARIRGASVSITVDPYSGRVLAAEEI